MIRTSGSTARRLRVSDKGSRASPGAHAHRANSPDRPTGPGATDRHHPCVAVALVRAGRLRATAFVALRSSGIPGARDRLVAICCAQHMATYGALRTMLRMAPEREGHVAACVLNAPDGEGGDSDR